MRKQDVKSVIQGNLFQEMLDTGCCCIHHVFPGNGKRKHCEKYGFLVAITPQMHEEAHRNINQGLSLMWKKICQDWYERNIGDRQDFIREFGRSYL